ncbi:alpha/beta fold hydrolase [Dactylosporangium sp. NPDC051541]|uniref:alpha/beta fold hydrolase n=1 Tax=Dactylosporangium sp. NPDC051541 TaxID=3363977 RepID=UPI0037B1E522
MVIERDVVVGDGRVLRAFDSGGDGAVVFWHHGTPHTGAFIAPLLAGAAARGVRLVTYARPGYGGSTVVPGRDVASAAGDAAAVADAFGVDGFAVMGASGGGPHALACAALLGGRVRAAAVFAGLAPYAHEDAWFAGMADDRALRAALEGRAARLEQAAHAEFNPAVFTDADWATLDGDWGALGQDAGRAAAFGPDGQVDDDIAYVSGWGFDPADVAVPVLIVHGDQDRMVPVWHGSRLAGLVPGAVRWERPDDGHVSVMSAYGDALDWLAAR